MRSGSSLIALGVSPVFFFFPCTNGCLPRRCARANVGNQSRSRSHLALQPFLFRGAVCHLGSLHSPTACVCSWERETYAPSALAGRVPGLVLHCFAGGESLFAQFQHLIS